MSVSTSFLAIVNPAAGGGRCGQRAPAAVERLRSGGLAVDVVETRRAGEATEIARAALREGRRNFVAVGGDGTGFEIVNGVLPEAGALAQRVGLGFLPLGTGNSFLRDFSTKGADHGVQCLLRGTHHGCDVVRIDHDGGATHFINLASIGFVADVAQLRQHRFRRLGEGGYVLAVVARVAALQAKVFPLRLDGGEWDRRPAVFLSFNNSKFTGGQMMMAPRADTSDGRLDVVRVGQMGRTRLLGAFPKIFHGTHLELPEVSETPAAVVEFALDGPVDVMVDGECLRLALRRMEVLPGAIDVYA
jgi:YegS/Rv2252/BmrU family lipid kinase